MSNSALLSYVFQPNSLNEVTIKQLEKQMTEILKTNGVKTPIIHFTQEDQTEKVIIYSHGNGSDLSSHYMNRIMYQGFKVDMICYDYCGYGVAQQYGSETTEELCVRNLKSVVEYALQCGYHAEDIILFGRSIGTGVTVSYAAEHPGTYGKIILMSPMTSAMNFIKPLLMRVNTFDKNQLGKFDMFTTLAKIDQINVPMFIIHGTLDTLVPFSQGNEIYKKHQEAFSKLKRKSYEPYWIIGADHNNCLNVCSMIMYCNVIRNFINYVE